MANTFGGKILVFDTQNNDVSYTAANDAANGGVKYSTQRYKVHSVQVIGAADGNTVELTECNPNSITGNTIYQKTFVTGNLCPPAEIYDTWFTGLMPKTIGGSCKILVTLS